MHSILMKAKSRRPTLFVWARLLRLLIPGDQAQITLNGRDGRSVVAVLVKICLRLGACFSRKKLGKECFL